MKDFRDLRIAYFSSTMVEGQDGVTRTIFKIADFLKEKNITSRYYTASFNEKSEEKLDLVKVNSFNLPFYKDYNIALPNKSKIFKDLDEFNPNILHFHTPCPLAKVAIKYGEKKNIPVFGTYHTHFPSYSRYYKLKFLEKFAWNYLRKIYNNADKVFVPTQSIISELEEHSFEHLVRLPNGIDLERFNESFFNRSWKKKIGADGKNILLFVGRLVWEKNLKVLVEVNEILRRKRSDFKFVFVGDGPAQEEMEKEMPDAIFTGRLAGRELSEAFASSDIFVFPSVTETFGIVILEAMASGLPPICVAEHGPLDLIIPGGNGLLAKPNDPEDFSKQIELMLDDSILRNNIKKNIRKFSENYDWNKVLNQMLNFYLNELSNFEHNTIFNNRFTFGNMNRKNSTVNIRFN